MYSGSLREITLELAHDVLEKLQIVVIPGHKLCPTCRVEIFNRVKQKEEENKAADDEEENFDSSDITTMEERERLNKTLTEMEFSPVKLHGIPNHSRHIEGRRKLAQVKEKIEECVAGAYSIDKDTLCEQSVPTDPALEQKAKDLDRLIYLLKEKMVVSTRSEKLQLLTLVPESWTSEKIMGTFPETTQYMVRQSRKLREEKGILGAPDKRKGRKLQQETINLVKSFYCSDEISRMM